MFDKLFERFYYWNRRRKYLKKLKDEASVGFSVYMKDPVNNTEYQCDFDNMSHAISYALSKIGCPGVQYVKGLKHGDNFISGRDLKNMYGTTRTIASLGRTMYEGPIRRN